MSRTHPLTTPLPPSRPLIPAYSILPRMAAALACGVVSLAAGGLSALGNGADWLLMATPLGPRLLGVPDEQVESHRLSDLLASSQRFNRERAAVFCPAFCDTQKALARAAAEEAATAAGPSTEQPQEQPQQQNQQQQRDEAVLQYSRSLAAAALWIGLTCKLAAEDADFASVPLRHLLSGSLVQQQLHRQIGPRVAAVAEHEAQVGEEPAHFVHKTGVLALGGQARRHIRSWRKG